MKLFAATLLLLLAFQISVFAQEEVEHNFEMKPQKTNCEELQIEKLTTENQILSVENSIFRFTQDFKLNRREGFQSAHYYSCDSKTGYVIAEIDNKKSLYSNISKELWEQFTTSGDFLNFIQKHFTNN